MFSLPSEVGKDRMEFSEFHSENISPACSRQPDDFDVGEAGNGFRF